MKTQQIESIFTNRETKTIPYKTANLPGLFQAGLVDLVLAEYANYMPEDG